MASNEPPSVTGNPAAIYKPIDSANYEIRLLQIPFSGHRFLGQEDPKPLSGKLVHYVLPVGSRSIPQKFVSAVTRRGYIALSYVWGDPAPTNEIIIDGHSIGITHSLYTALRQLQSDAFGEESVWVDALCINQADDAEKSAQIRNMREVYHNAMSVRVWLGHAYGASDEVYQCMKYIQVLTDSFLPDQYQDSHDDWEASLLPFVLKPVFVTAHTALSGWHKINMFKETFQGPEEQRKAQLQMLKHADSKKFWQEYLDWRPRAKDLEKFLKLVPDGDLSVVARMIEKYILVEPTWFSRIWVVQEVGVAWESIEICRGPYNITWDSLLSVVFYLHFTCEVVVSSIEKVMGLEVIRQGFREGKRRRLCELMHECRYRKASDPRDKIYALYGLMGDSIDDFIKPDYTKSVEEVYTHATLHFIAQSQSLDPICGQQVMGRRPGLPTWVPDYELDQEQVAEPLIPQDGEPVVFHASGYDERCRYRLPDPGLSLIEWSIMHVRGVRIGRVDIISNDLEENTTFENLQQDWQNTMKQSLLVTNSGTDRSPNASLDAITKLIDGYSALYSGRPQPRHKSAEPVSTSSSDVDFDFEKLSLQQDFFTSTTHSMDIDYTNPIISAYINVLTTGRSNSSIRVSPPNIPPLPSSIPNPNSSQKRIQSSLLPTAKAKRSTTSLLNGLPKVFSSSKSSIKRVDSTDLQGTTDRDPKLSSVTNSEHASIDHESQPSKSSKAHQDALATAAHLDACIRRKRFFVTSEGSFGSGPKTLQRGDVVVVLYGCSVPVVLRQVRGGEEGGKDKDGNSEDSNEIGGKWELVGEAFVDRFMDAEALAWVVKGQLEVESFVLV